MARRKKDYLVFIDTNIYLDFYRSQNDAELSLLYELLKIKNKIISTDQVEMEFKKNRQKVIIESLNAIPTPNVISFPAFALKIKWVKRANRIMKELKTRVKQFKDYFAKVMLEPRRYDKVYKACQEIFEYKSNLNLRRPDKERYKIRSLARKRFMLGYPPRKSDSITLGDTINWEWIVTCCNKEKKDVVIVSRDGDYGITFNGKSFMNDWLNEEFKSRISPRRKVFLTNKLSEALKKLSVLISKEAEKAETNLSARVNLLGSSTLFTGATTAIAGTTGIANSYPYGFSPYGPSSQCSICGKPYPMTLGELTLPPGSIMVCEKCRSASK